MNNNRMIEGLPCKIETKIEEGVSGMVYKGTWGDIPVAVKLITKRNNWEYYEKEEYIFDLLSQSKQHQNIIQLINKGEIDSYYYLMLEYMSLGDCFNMIAKNPNVTSAQFNRIFFDVAQGLTYLHGLRIIHRDLKLENILINERLQAKICDFGFSELLDDDEESYTSENLCGSIQYIAPELWKGQSKREYVYSRASDVYAAGIILYLLHMKTQPYVRLNEAKTEYIVMQPREIRRFLIDRQRPSIDHDKVSSDVSYLIEQLWTQQPEERPVISEVIKHPLFSVSIEDSSSDCQSQVNASDLPPISTQPQSSLSLNSIFRNPSTVTSLTKEVEKVEEQEKPCHSTCDLS